MLSARGERAECRSENGLLEGLSSGKPWALPHSRVEASGKACLALSLGGRTNV